MTQTPVLSEQDIAELHDALVMQPKAVERLGELRGWTIDAIDRLQVGMLNGCVTFPYRRADGSPAGLMTYQPNPDKLGDGEPKTRATPGSTRELFPRPESLASDAILWLVEGEPDAVAAHSIGLEATGLPGSTSWRPEWAPRFKDRHVVVCMDCDQAGRKAASVAAESLAEHVASLRVLDLNPARDDGYDLSDLITDAKPDERAGVRQVLETMAQQTPAFVREADRPPAPRLSLERYRQILTDHLEGKAPTPAWPIPFADLMEATDGGIRPGEVWVIGGWTSNGKSTYADMLADSVSAAGASVHVYGTEMTAVQRGLRHLSRRTRIPFRDLRNPDRLTPQLRERAVAEIARLPYAQTIVHDWSAAQVAADARAHGTNVVIVDLLHGFPYEDERELTALYKDFAGAATSEANAGRGTAVVLVAHLNSSQLQGSRSPARPRPGLHSFKGARSIEQNSDVVLMVWRKDDENGRPTDEGEIYIAKNRNGGLGTAEVRFDKDLIRFITRSAYA